MPEMEVLKRLLLSLFLGGLIGIERELKKRSAGLRTHILVCMGSSLIMLTSLYVFDIYKDISQIDPSRIAAQVVTGIGFIGAGAILRSGEGVLGLTTAASLWIAAGIGLAVGCGFYSAAIAATILVLVVLMVIRKFEKFIKAESEVD